MKSLYFVADKEYTEEELQAVFDKDLSRAIAQAKQLMSQNDIDNWCLRESIGILVKASEPIMPHLAEECWLLMGNPKSIIEERWPEVCEKLLEDDQCTIIIQVNGKKRAEIKMPIGVDEKSAFEEAITISNVANYIDNQRNIKKKIFIPNKILNIVI